MIRPFFPLLGALALTSIFQPAVAAQATAPAEPDGTSRVDASAAPSLDFTLVEHRISAPDQPPPIGRTVPARPRVPSGPSRASEARAHVLAYIRAAEMRHALPRGLLEALVEVESAFQPGATSQAGAMGLAQLMPATARALGVLNPFDARANVDGGARYLRTMLDRFGSIHLALAAYNAGPGSVLRSRGVPVNSETPGYIRRVLAAWALGGSR